MPQGPAARLSDVTAHGIPLAPGPPSPNVLIGFLPAWLALPTGAGAALQAANAAADVAMKTLESATKAASGTPAAPAAIAAETAGKMALTTAANAMAGAMASTGASMHMCPMPTPPIPVPHGPGFVIDGSKTVMINNLPACRMGDTVMEILGGPDKIVKGEPTVIIGG
ncbi:MAG: hypothetical protein FJW38_30400 [Acidobacteria bacterium]|nr:hypothetical protein [Acidobacteriota bacterium]